MKKTKIVKTSMCLAAAVLIAANVHFAKAETTGTDTAVAGITLSLDNYYNATIQNALKKLDANVATTQSLESTPIDEAQVANETATGDQTNSTTEEAVQVSPYDNMGISIANDYVNIRSKASEDSEILGKLYKGSSAEILDTNGEWVKVKSGSVEGYIKSSFLAIGKEAEKVAEQYGTKLATVATTTLKVREEKNQDSTVLTLIPEGESYEVIKEYDGWVKIQIDEDLKGYVSTDYVTTSMKFDKAISIEEEKAKEEEKKRREEEAKKAEEAREAQQNEQQSSSSSSSSSSNSSSNNSSSSSSSSSNSSSNSSSSNNSSSSSSSNDNSSSNDSSNNSSSGEVSGNASAVIAYAKQFLGNPYVYGGTSLTNGTDCSGFTMSVYAHFGYSIPRTSRDQSNAGVAVDFNNIQPGDLVFYTNGSSVNHVAMYIGGGQVIHASNPSTGIRTSYWKYRSPYKVRRIIQ